VILDSIPDGLLLFEFKSSKGYHEEMNSNVFDGWFQTILTLVELNSVVLMDNSIVLQSPGRMFTYNNLAKSEHLKLAIRKENQF
jgi:hypothetical protein